MLGAGENKGTHRGRAAGPSITQLRISPKAWPPLAKAASCGLSRCWRASRLFTWQPCSLSLSVSLLYNTAEANGYELMEVEPANGPSGLLTAVAVCSFSLAPRLDTFSAPPHVSIATFLRRGFKRAAGAEGGKPARSGNGQHAAEGSSRC
ncbi:hypothetical protein JZ751_017119 [Albula glossodonta]|uniref:Uncharacterized protein n=1 Tax=Albula glossodonta TaxID=121402 RepID=A0A8T2NSJ8_9TELE|nr:hypothetical protein JZ751_017119 [Albula glossodonta]